MKTRDHSGQAVESVRRAFALLEELNSRSVSSVSDLHKATHLPKATIVRLLDTMRTIGYVANDPRQGGYRVTSRTRVLGRGFDGDPLVLEATTSVAMEFTKRHKIPVVIAVRDRDSMLIRFSNSSDGPLSPNDRSTVNGHLRMLTRATGRAYLAYCPIKERTSILNALRSSNHPEDAIAHRADEVASMIDRVRRNGFAERSATVEPICSNSFGVPVMHGGQVLATIGVSYFRSSMPRAKAISRYVPPLIELARTVEDRIHSLSRHN